MRDRRRPTRVLSTRKGARQETEPLSLVRVVEAICLMAARTQTVGVAAGAAVVVRSFVHALCASSAAAA